MKSVRTAFLLFMALFFAAGPAFAEDDAAAQDLFNKLLLAQDTKNYDAFVANGTTELKAALTRTQFEASSDVLAQDQAGGSREITFLGELNQRGYEVYLFRVRFKTGDLLGTLTLDKDGKVAGIWFK